MWRHKFIFILASLLREIACLFNIEILCAVGRIEKRGIQVSAVLGGNMEALRIMASRMEESFLEAIGDDTSEATEPEGRVV